MAFSVTHTFASAIADDGAAAAAGEVLPSHWNATHTISLGGTDTRLLYDNAGVIGEALIRYSAANLFLGDADAASPVAQTLSPQNVVAGTSNGVGADLTIAGSIGTGSGAGGSIVFKTAPAGGSGTSQNALATAMTISGTGLVTIPKLSTGCDTYTPTFAV